MKKFLRTFAVAALAMVGSASYAQTVTLDFTNGDDAAAKFGLTGMSWAENKESGIEESTAGNFAEQKTATVDGVKFTVSTSGIKTDKDGNPVLDEDGNEVANTPNRIWKQTNGKGQLRVYAGTLTISAASGIKTITFDKSSKFNLEADNGTIEDGVWTGDATEIVFTAKSQSQINAITVSFEEGGSEPVVDIANTPETAYTVAKAKELIDAGKGLDTKVYVKGTIAELHSKASQANVEKYGNIDFFLEDGFEAYRCLNVGNTKFTSLDQIKVGDEVILYGQLTKYNSTYELAAYCYIYSLNGVTTGIHAAAAEASDAPAYNLAGQRVSDSYRGVVIRGGKKMLQK